VVLLPPKHTEFTKKKIEKVQKPKKKSKNPKEKVQKSKRKIKNERKLFVPDKNSLAGIHIKNSSSRIKTLL